METRSLLDSSKVIRKRVVSWFRPSATFDPASMRGVVFRSSISTTLIEVLVYMSLARSAKYGQLPGYTPDMVLGAIAAFECIAAPFVSWVGHWRRQRTLMIWHLVFIVVVFTLFLLPSVDVGDGNELCTGHVTVVNTQQMSSNTIVRLCMLVTVGVVSSLTRLGIWSHGLGYIEEYSSANTSMHFGIVILARAMAFLQGREVIRNAVNSTIVTDLVMTLAQMVIHVLILPRFHQHAPGIKELFKASSYRRGFFSSVARVLTNAMAVAQMVSMGILTSAVWGFFLYDVDMAKTKFLISPQTNFMFTLIDPLRTVVAIAVVVLFSYKYSAPLMPTLDRLACMKKAVAFSIFSIILYMLLTFMVNCTTGTLAGFSATQYVQPNCSLHCRCDPSYDDFSPVCMVDTMTTYYSPCQAGCANYTNINGFKVNEEDNVTGHRLIEIDYFLKELRKISNHKSLFSCGLSTLKVVSENRSGLLSKFKIVCQMCRQIFEIKNSTADVNKNAVSGIMSAGCGLQQLNNLFAALDIPSMSDYMYNIAHDKVCNEWELTAWEEMRKAGERERLAAIEEGRVNKDGVAIIDVEVDGSWCKRSYRTNYSAASGAAAIIGRRYGQVLFISVKNKYCCICARAEKRNETVKEHACYKNFDGPSTAMEANIIVEGFKRSMEMHNLIYSRFVADGDSSTYAKILEARPYPGITVEKINCKNHILRNFCNKLQQLKSDTKYNIKERKFINNEKILKSRKYITDAIKLHGSKTAERSENIKSLHKDISMSIYHGFGIHSDCNKEICNVDTETNPEFTVGILWQRLRYIVANVASQARSLIENADSNKVESFNGVIAKFIGGKRVNYSLRRSYQARCAGAVVDFNTKKILSTVQQNIYQGNISERLRKYEDKKFKKIDRNRQAERKKKRYVVPKKLDTNYGENADKPDMDPATFDLSKQLFLDNLKKSEEERRDIEKRTVLQSDCGEWMELRRNLLTASNFGKVIKRNYKNSCQNIVKNMLYKANIDHVESISHGKKYEKIALSHLSELLNIQIEECGLFIDDQLPLLGATPDGIVKEKNIIVEIKCPILPFKTGNIEETIKQGKMHFWRFNKNTGEITVNKRSDWYFQIQGQLHITKKDTCILGVWYGENKIKIERVEKDDEFWQQVMEPKLKKFYFDCLLPELIDPRLPRNRPIRNPDYVKKTSTNNDKENHVE